MGVVPPPPAGALPFVPHDALQLHNQNVSQFVARGKRSAPAAAARRESTAQRCQVQRGAKMQRGTHGRCSAASRGCLAVRPSRRVTTRYI